MRRGLVPLFFILVIFGLGFFGLASAAPALSNVRAENIYYPGAKIKWDTNVQSDSKVFYGISPENLSQSVFGDCYGGTTLTSHCVNLTGLSESTTYYYKAKSSDGSGEGESATLSFNSGSGGGGGSIPTTPSNLRLDPVPTASAVYLKWNDNSSNEDKFNVEREVAASMNWTLLTQSGANATTYTDSSVSSGVSYNYRVQACLSGYGCSDYVYLMGVSPAAPADTQPPSAPAGLIITFVSSSQISFSWGASSDNVGVTEYKIFKNNSFLASVSQSTLSYSDTGLSGGVLHSYYVKAKDAAGNESLQSNTMSTTTLSTGNGGGGSIPTTPSNLRLEPSPTASAIYLKWNDNSSNEDKFNVEREVSGSASWTLLTQTGANVISYTDSSITAGTYYSYRVQACRSGYGCSAYTYLYNVSTSGTPSNYPSVPVNLSATVVSSSQINISWTPSTDDVGVAYYYVHRNGAFLASVTAASYSDVGLSPNTTYSYIVSAIDGDGNSSGWSSALSATTASASSGATDNTDPVISNIRAENIIGAGAQILWSTDDPSSSFVKYGTSPGNLLSTSASSCDFGGYVTSHCINLTGLAANTTYYYKVESTNASALWVASLEKSFISASTSTTISTTTSTTASNNIPSAPSNLRLDSSPASTTIYLKWNDNSSNEDKFNVEREVAGSASWTTLIQTGANISIYIDSSVTSGTTYNYRVQACRSGYGCSVYTYLYGVSTSGAVPTQGDTTPPTVVEFGYFTEPDGRLRAGALFSEFIDQASVSSSNIYIIKSSDGSKLLGTVGKYTDGVDYVTSVSVIAGVDYQLLIKKNIKDLAGNQMVVDYLSPKIRKGTSTAPYTPEPPITTVFAVDPSVSFPHQGETGVDVVTRIRIKLTKEIDPVSTATQFFTLESSLNPGVNIGGTFYFSFDGFEFAPSPALKPGTTYIYKVFTTLKDKTGANLSGFYSASFTTSSGISVKSGTISGTVKDVKDLAVAGAGVQIFTKDYAESFFASTDSGGKFNLAIPEGTYSVEVFPPPARTDLLRPQPQQVSVIGGGIKTLDLKFTTSFKTIMGTVTFPDLKAVSDAEVGAYSSETNQWIGVFTDSFGKFTLKVAGGKWSVGLRPKDPITAKWFWSGPFQEVSFVKDSTSETKTVDFIVSVANSTLIVTTIDETGSIVSGAGVVADTLRAVQSPTTYDTRIPPEYRRSDSTGRTIFVLPGKTYYVRGFLPVERGYLNPPEQEVILPSNETRNIRLVFPKKDAVAFLLVRGLVKLNSGNPTDAFIWAWSENGRYADTRSVADGKFELRLVVGDKWHIGAGKESGGFPYKSSELIVESDTSPITIELALRKVQDAPLPSSVSVSQVATEPSVAQVTDGAKITVSAGSAASSGTVNIEVKPTVEAPSQAAARVVSTVYNVVIRDDQGNEVTKLTSDAELVLPYDTKKLESQGVTEDKLVPSFFDENTNTWVKIDDYTIDKEKKVVIARINHLTRFAIVAAADITPPSAPTVVSVQALGGGEVKVIWANPSRDFDHAKVYRSEKSGVLGEVVAAEVFGGEHTDRTVKGGLIYYYAVRAVDPAGNESTNVNQTSVKAIGTYVSLVGAPVNPKTVLQFNQELKSSVELPRDLSVGMEGEDVKALQQFLLDENVYAEGLITGYFGSLTQKAVIRFQEKYADDILVPVGLSRGTGYAGPSTRKKIQELGGVSAGQSVITSSQTPGSEIIRDLYRGLEGGDVRNLQQFLLDEDVYPEGLVTGYFGTLTHNAVVRFQEKYADDILVSVGLSEGTGFVGPSTRRKLNDLLGN